jgi:hypothetical protein
MGLLDEVGAEDLTLAVVLVQQAFEGAAVDHAVTVLAGVGNERFELRIQGHRYSTFVTQQRRMTNTPVP